MVDYNSLRKKFPSKSKDKSSRAAKIKAIANEYERKKAELGASLPLAKRGFPYYMTVLIALMLVGGLVIPRFMEHGAGGKSKAEINLENATKDVHSLAVALGRYRYHTGVYPTTEQGLDQLALKRLPPRESVEGWMGPYIRKLKPDPWGNPYVYENNGEDETPTLYSLGPDGEMATTDDIIVNPDDFDEPFRETAWAKTWMPQHLRGYVVAQNEAHKKRLEAEVDAVLHPEAAEAAARLVADTLRVTPVELLPDADSPTQAVIRIAYETKDGPVSNDYDQVHPVLWTPERPFRDVTKIDGRPYKYALRTMAWTPETGFVLNGKPLALRAVTVPSVGGLLVDRFDREAARRMLMALHDMGANAVKSGADPVPRDFADLCDEIGLICLDAPEFRAIPDDDFIDCGEVLTRTGEPRLSYYARRADWNASAKTIHLYTHWNWDGKEGEPIRIACLTDGDEAELFLNDDSVGKRTKSDESGLAWDVPYESGQLKVVVRKGGAYHGEAELRTAMKPAAVRLKSESTHLKPSELAFVTVDTIDAFDVFEPTAENTIELTIEGPGEFVSAGNAMSVATDVSGRKLTQKLVAGRATVVVKRQKGSGKPILLRAKSGSLRPAQLDLLKR